MTTNTTASNPFKTPFTGSFTFNPALYELPEETIKEFDRKVAEFTSEALQDFRETLRNRNELLVSYAVSKAERMNKLHIGEARAIQYELDNDSGYTPAPAAINDEDAREIKHQLDRLEFYNILKTFKAVSKDGITPDDLSIEFICNLHAMLTKGLDNYLAKIKDSSYYAGEPYCPGILRGRDDIVVGDYTPVESSMIKEELEGVLDFYRKNPSLDNLGLFSIAFYSIHPFNNGNKRVTRMLEHGLMRDLGLNKNNIYSHLYHYFKDDMQLIETMQYSLTTKNYTPMANYIRNAMFFAQISVFKTAAEKERNDFAMARETKMTPLKTKLLRMLVKSKSLSARDLRMAALRGASERHIYDTLSDLVASGTVSKKSVGRFSFYYMNMESEKEVFVKNALREAGFLPHQLPKHVQKGMYHVINVHGDIREDLTDCPEAEPADLPMPLTP